jgi:hypothetical protein
MRRRSEDDADPFRMIFEGARVLSAIEQVAPGGSLRGDLGPRDYGKPGGEQGHAPGFEPRDLSMPDTLKCVPWTPPATLFSR